MFQRRRKSSLGRNASCKKLAINRSIGDKLEKVYKWTPSAWSSGSNLKMVLKEYSNQRSVQRVRRVFNNKSY